MDAKFLLLFNAHGDPRTFTLPEASLAPGWEVVIDTSTAEAGDEEARAAGARSYGAVLMPKSEVEVGARAAVVLRSTD